MPGGAPVNTDASSVEWPTLGHAERQVPEIQTKLHRWARADFHRQFVDLFNFVCDPAYLTIAWDQVRSNKGLRTAGVDGVTVVAMRLLRGEEEFLADLRASLNAGTFRPLPVRERTIPKPGSSKRRRLGIPTDVANRCDERGREDHCVASIPHRDHLHSTVDDGAGARPYRVDHMKIFLAPLGRRPRRPRVHRAMIAPLDGPAHPLNSA